MLTSTNTINSPIRSIIAKVELYSGSILVDTYNYNDILVSAEIERVGENSKFFGFGVSQKVNIKLIDTERLLNITTDNCFKVYFKTIEEEYPDNFPMFCVTEVNRDENTNQLSITAYDDLKAAEAHTIAELELTSYTIEELAAAVADILGFNGLVITGLIEGETCFTTSYPEGANFAGTETLRAVLNFIAEATQTIYYLNGNNNLVFKRLSSGNADLIINKAQYFTLDSSTNRRLAAITHATELGDNVTAAMEVTGTTQYVRNNPLWELRDDIAALLDNAIAAIGALTINQFNCNWRGNYLLEVGDKIALVTKDNNTVNSYVLNDVISYNGAFSQVTEWSYTDNDSETETNPTNIGEAIKQTIARVDKANQQIQLLVETVEGTDTAFNEYKQTAESTIISIGERVTSIEEDGATKVKVEGKDYTFDANGFRVARIATEGETGVLDTTITEDGMRVNRDGEAVLTANNEGVVAEDLHATTYLIIGNNSRFEDYGTDRTGCFWIGG